VLAGARVEGVDRKGTALRVHGTSANPRIAHSLCADCGACLDACPARALVRKSRAGLTQYVVDASRCLLHRGKACTACIEACGYGAISGAGAAQAFDLRVDGAVLATGHETFDPSCKPRLGYGRIPGVITGLEAERILADSAFLPAADGTPAADVAFVQCVGSRDPSLCRNFCSAVCCAYALRMARVLKARNPAASVTVYSIDIQNFDKVFTPFRAGVEAAGVSIVRGVPSLVNRTSSGRLELLIEDPRGGESRAQHDAVVLSVGMAAADGAARVASLFGLSQDEFGFFSSALPGVRTAGTCVEPQSLVDAMASGRAAAAELLAPAAEARAAEVRA
jgi:heterodisulfide reductase subunit A